MVTNYALHKRLSVLYRESDFVGPYSAWLKSIGYTKGCHGGAAVLEAVEAAAAAKRKKEEEERAAGATAVA